MIKRPITYTDADDETVTEDFYFHLSQAELLEWEVEHKEGLATVIQNILKAEDRKEIVAIFKRLVLDSYGIKTPDGKGFEKSDELRTRFANTFAYQTLFMELATDDKKASEFINGIVPKELGEAMKKSQLEEKTAAALKAVPKDDSEVEQVAEAPTPPSA